MKPPHKLRTTAAKLLFITLIGTLALDILAPISFASGCLETVSQPSGRIIVAHSSKKNIFALYDANNPHFFYIWANLINRTIVFDLYTRSPRGKRSALPPGRVLFAQMINYFGIENIDAIQGNWVPAQINTASDNIAMVNEYLAKNPQAPLTEAVWASWTAKQAKKHGFSHATVIHKREHKIWPGQYDTIVVEFKKTAGPPRSLHLEGQKNIYQGNRAPPKK